MATGSPSTAQAIAGGPKPAPPIQSEAVQSKRDLASWWKQFKRSDKKPQEQSAPAPGIFGIPLHSSIRYANVAISLFNDEGQSYIYGYVPIVVAKCGVFLKEKATDVEGIFRLAGSEKRIKELKIAFDSPDRYGKGLDWTGYTVHDAANILRRYFNQLPEPIIPLEFYERFRDPLRNHQAQAVGAMDAQSPTIGDFDQDGAIRIYQALITELPPLNRQLLLYILDLLAVFASKSDLNKMTTPNLAAIFQPGLLSHPQHDMAPQEYRLSQDVLIFLIENQDSFLIGMPGTAADHQTVKEVQSGVPSPSKVPASPVTPSRSKTVVNRSSSNASTNAESRWSNLRRNVSVSSKHSKRSEAGPTPVTPSIGTPATPVGSVHRSNTVPSRRPGGAAPSSRFPREKTSDPSTPNRASPVVQPVDSTRQESLQSTPVASIAPALPLAPPSITSASSSEATTPLATIASDTSSAVTRDFQTPKKDTTPLLAPAHAAQGPQSERQGSGTPTGPSTHGFLNIFKQSPSSDGEGRKPNKLQKKRIPGSALSSAQSSVHDLRDDGADHTPIPAALPGLVNDTYRQAEYTQAGEQSHYATAQTTPSHVTPQRMPTDATLKPTLSPSHSFTSHTDVTDQSDADMVGDDMPASGGEPERKERRRHRWRFSRSQNKLDQPTSPPPPGGPLGMMSPKEQAMSRSTIGSSNASASQPRRSFQEATPLGGQAIDPNQTPTQTPGSHGGANDTGVFSDSERERRGPMGWIRGKIQERKERDAEKRNQTPERNQSSANGRQEFGTPSHMDSLPERPRDISGSSAAANNDISAPPSNVPTGAEAAPSASAPVSESTPTAADISTPTAQSQPSNEASTTQAPAEPATMSIAEARPPTAPNDPAVHDRVDAVMGGK
ncbi:hypothetical protein Q7P37_003721 [Cladosporium fusiforme]